MLHMKFEPLTFRLSAWPWGGNSYVRYYNHLTHNIFINPILEYLEQELRNVPIVKVRKTTFTLVNVHSKFTDIAYGRNPPPPEGVVRGPVSFTFAFTRRDTTPMVANHKIWTSGMSCIWGPNLQYSHDYLTISLPISLSAQCRLNNTLMPQMELLYKLIGGWSKSIALNKRAYTDRTTDLAKIRGEFYHRSIPRTMWYYPWKEWKFCREFWDQGQDMLDLRAPDNVFVAYYIKNLTQFHRKSVEPNVVPVFDVLEQTVRSVLLDLAQNQTTDLTLVIEPVLPSDLVAKLRSGESMQIDQLATEICRGNI